MIPKTIATTADIFQSVGMGLSIRLSQEPVEAARRVLEAVRKDRPQNLGGLALADEPRTDEGANAPGAIVAVVLSLVEPARTGAGDVFIVVLVTGMTDYLVHDVLRLFVLIRCRSGLVPPRKKSSPRMTRTS